MIEDGVVVGKIRDCIMKDETEEVDRGHIMKRGWILSHGHEGAIVDFEIRDRHD